MEQDFMGATSERISPWLKDLIPQLLASTWGRFETEIDPIELALIDTLLEEVIETEEGTLQEGDLLQEETDMIHTMILEIVIPDGITTMTDIMTEREKAIIEVALQSY